MSDRMPCYQDTTKWNALGRICSGCHARTETRPWCVSSSFVHRKLVVDIGADNQLIVPRGLLTATIACPATNVLEGLASCRMTIDDIVADALLLLACSQAGMAFAHEISPTTHNPRSISVHGLFVKWYLSRGLRVCWCFWFFWRLWRVFFLGAPLNLLAVFGLDHDVPTRFDFINSIADAIDECFGRAC